MTDLTTTPKQTAVAIPSEFQGFTEAEALGGMAQVNESYLKSFKYFLNRPSTRAKFEIRNNETDEVVWEGDKIDGAIVYYAHEVLRLKRGHVESPEKNEIEFTEEENEILAVTYDKANSKGNFEANGYGKYLTKEYADLQGKMTRLYVFMLIPSLKDKIGLELVAGSFSVTTVKSFNALRKSLKAYGMLPLPLVFTNIFFTEAKSESGQVYDRVDFALAKGEDGGLQFVHKSADAYRSSERGLKLLNAIIETHKGAVLNAESGGYGGVEKEVPSTFEDGVNLVKDTFHGKEVSDPLDKGPF